MKQSQTKYIQGNRRGASDAIKIILILIIMIVFILLFWNILSSFIGVGPEYTAFSTLKTEIEDVCQSPVDTSRTISIYLPVGQGGPSKSDPCWRSARLPSIDTPAGALMIVYNPGYSGVQGQTIPLASFCSDTTYFWIEANVGNALSLRWITPDKEKGGTYKISALNCGRNNVESFSLSSTADTENHDLEIVKEGTTIILRNANQP